MMMMEKEEELRRAYEMNLRHVSDRTVLMAFIEELMGVYESTFESLEASYLLIDKALVERPALKDGLASAFAMQRIMHDAVVAEKEAVFEEVAL